MSISGATRRNPRIMRPSKSASAWNLTRMPRPLQFGNQFGVRSPRLAVLYLCGALTFDKVRIDFLLVREIERERAVHLLKGQRRVGIDHALGRHSLAKEKDEGIQGHTRLRHAIHAFSLLYVFLLHS